MCSKCVSGDVWLEGCRSGDIGQRIPVTEQLVDKTQIGSEIIENADIEWNCK